MFNDAGAEWTIRLEAKRAEVCRVHAVGGRQLLGGAVAKVQLSAAMGSGRGQVAWQVGGETLLLQDPSARQDTLCYPQACRWPRQGSRPCQNEYE